MASNIKVLSDKQREKCISSEHHSTYDIRDGQREFQRETEDSFLGTDIRQWCTVYKPTTVTLKYKHQVGVRRYAASLKHLLPVRVRTGPGNFMPVDQAGCCALTFFSWLTPLVWRIFRKGFSLLDIYHCSPFDSCRVNGARLSSLWDQEVKIKGLERSSLQFVFFHFLRTRFILSCIMYVFCVAFGFLGPTVFMRLLLQYIQSSELDHILGIKWMSGLVICEFLRVVSMSLMWAISTRTAVRANSAILALLYYKMMRVRPVVSTTLGELINSFANDSQKVFMMAYNAPLIIGGPLVIMGTLIYTWWILGAVSLVGVGIFATCYALQFCISYINAHFRKQAVKASDERVSIMTELLMYIRLIKLYAWEKPLVGSVRDARSHERTLLEKCQYLQILSSSIAGMSSLIVTIITILVYTLIGYNLSPAQAFTLVMVYSIAGHGIRTMPLCFQDMVNGSVALGRLQIIMKLEERENYITLPTNPDLAVYISKATLAWDPITPCVHSVDKTKKGEINFTLMENEKIISTELEAAPDDSLVPSGESDLLPSLVDISLSIPKGKLVGVCGMVGSGKSSLLSALLGQKRLLKGQVSVRGSYAYVSQQSWILNGSLRDNILFDHPFNSKRYYEAVYCCSLTDDIASLPAGDQTQIGERGVTLSGGQKQRINLARALYADKELYLLDDPLSAVDSHVGRHIFQHFILAALKEKTVFLVTHQLEYLPECDIIILMKNGQIVEHGTHEELMGMQSEYATLVTLFKKEAVKKNVQNKEERLLYSDHESPQVDLCPLLAKKLSLTHSRSVGSLLSELPESDIPDGHLVDEEKMATGKVSWDTYRCFIQAAGGYFICAVVIFWFLLQAAAETFSNWWLSYWLSQGDGVKYWSNVTEKIRDDEINEDQVASIIDNEEINFYQLIYGLSVAVMVIVSIIMGFLFTKTSLRASSTLHDTVLVQVFCSPMHFFDTVPSGRILNIFTRDTDEIDIQLPGIMASLLQRSTLIICTLLMMALVFPWFLLPMACLGIVFIFLQRIFCATMRDLKRIENVSRSPIYSHISTTLQGLSTIRAFQKQDDFVNRYAHLVDANASPLYLFYSSMRWLGTRMDILCVIITLITALFTVFFKGHVDASLSALALVFALKLSGIYQYVVRLSCEVETRFTSVERIHSYIQSLESEVPRTNEINHPSPEWPTRGRISCRDVTMRYRPGLPLALKGLTFDISPQEKIGIVGRTGSGKSSIGAVLFRLVELSSGYIYIDGVDISKIGLEDLRSKMSIIPQDPVLFHGTVRYNLDPLDEKNDQELWDALGKIHIKDKVSSLEGGLEAIVTEGGENFSVGEKQLLCIARALMRCNKVLLLDEATAAIDSETDSLIQKTIQEVFADCTVLIIAHRLNTVLNCDRVMVLSDGKIIEFEKPSALLDNPNSLFSKLMVAEAVSPKL